MKKILVALTLVCMLSSQCFAINDWKQGLNTDAIQGTDVGADIDANLKNYAVDPLDRMLSGYIHGCTLTRTDAATITISAGEVCCSNGAGTIKRMRKNTATTTASMGAVGVGGIDSGSAEAATTIYDVYAVADANATTFTAIIAKHGTALSDVTYYRYLGSFFNNAAQDIDDFTFIGNGSSCKIYFDNIFSNNEYRVLNAGGAVAFTNVDCSGLVPSDITDSVDIQVQVSALTAMVYFRKDGSSATNGFAISLYALSNVDCAVISVPVSSGIFEYKLVAGTVSMWVKGYTFSR